MTGSPAALVLPVAPAGAGKSTWVARHFDPNQVVCLDSYRWMLTGDEATQTATSEAVTIMHTVVAGRMRRRLLTAVDATNYRVDIRAEILRHATRWQVPAVAVVFRTPLEVCIARQEARSVPTPECPNGKVVPTAVITRMHEAIAKDPPTLDEFACILEITETDGSLLHGQVPEALRALPWLA